MNKETFIVSYSSSRNCFLKFSRNYLGILNSLKLTIPALKLEYGLDKSAYFSWSYYQHNSDDNVVFLSAKYAQKLGIAEKEIVQISVSPDVLVVKRAYITALSVDDLAILESNSSKLQSTLLKQVRIVFSGQVLVVWASKNVHLALKVGNLEPHCSVGYLENFTEVVLDSSHNYINHYVKPQITENDSSQISAPANKLKTQNDEYSGSLLPLQSLWSSLRTSFSSFQNKYSKSITFGCEIDVMHDESNFKLKNNYMLLRVNPWKHNTYFCELSFVHPYTVFVSKELIITENLEECFDSLLCKINFVPCTPKLVKDNSVPSVMHELDKPLSDFHKETLIVQAYILDNVLNNVPKGIKQDLEFYSCHQSIYVSETVMNSMKLQPGCRVKIEECTEPKHCVKQLRITVADHWDKDDESIISLFRGNLKIYTKDRRMLLNSGILFPLLDEANNIFYIIITLLPLDATYFLVDFKVASEISILVERRSMNSAEFQKKTQIIDSQTGDLTVRWLHELLWDGMITLKMSLNFGSIYWMSQNFWPKVSVQNILITGGSGSGKSCLAKLLVEKIKSSPFFVHTEEHNCKELKGKSVDSIQRTFTSTLSDCVYYQPSVILLDDLDAIAGTTEQELSDPSYFNRVSEMLCSLLETFQERNFITIIATAEELSKLNPLISDSRGQHIFKTVLEIPKLTKNHRHDIMKGILNNANNVNIDNCTDKDLEEFAVKTDGYVLQDLNDFVAKSILECWKRMGINDNETPYLEYKDLSSAFNKSIPMALRGVSLYHETNCSWDDVGGLRSVKEILIEMLEWPTQYPELFEQSPLRHQSGILLYGAPGTGKTLLASAVAKECGLNFISIKGPELLSKYIGASEEAVRKIFQKAQVAKPCILFFDEFDSLAPRRGHDNTGVTDRVVNQLLTQLDGVEGLHGVWVLAASSRPDLLDPALLRPGRLDQTVLCPLPSEDDRKCILQVLSRKLNLSNDINFEEISKKSDGFTGADLQAVLYTAQIMSMEDIEDTNEETVILSDMPEIENKEWKVISNPEQIIVTQKHVLAALAKTKPSLSVSEKFKYETIYENFRSSRKYGRNEEIEITVPRVTLA